MPVRCVTCGKCLANKHKYYQAELNRKKIMLRHSDGPQHLDPLFVTLNVEDIKKTIAGEIMDELGLIRMCCRKTMLTTITLIEEI